MTRRIAPAALAAALFSIFLSFSQTAAAAPTAAARSGCAGRPYSYSGLISATPASGVKATLTALAAPGVATGHTAGWIGIGGEGAGPNGETEWLQVGLSGFPGGRSELYAELTLAGRSPIYKQLLPSVAPGESHTVALIEVAPSVWRVELDGRFVSKAVRLPGSHGAWAPMAIGESWNAGRPVCNGYRYRFSRLSVRTASGWRAFQAPQILADPGYGIVARTAAGFVAASR